MKTVQYSNKNWVRLPLQNADNVRELGGYPVSGGGQTAYHRFLRADDISRLSESDVRFLLGYGVNCVLDLRCDTETRARPDTLASVPGVLWKNIPFMRGELGDVSQYSSGELSLDLGEMYLEFLEDKEKIRELFSFLADTGEGCVLFHCSAGKDRTGVMALLLMMLAGADKQDCMTNYGQSYTNLCRQEKFARAFEQELPQEAGKLRFSDPETIAPCYDKIMEEFGGIRPYLRACGLEEGQITSVYEKLVKE